MVGVFIRVEALSCARGCAAVLERGNCGSEKLSIWEGLWLEEGMAGIGFPMLTLSTSIFGCDSFFSYSGDWEAIDNSAGFVKIRL